MYGVTRATLTQGWTKCNYTNFSCHSYLHTSYFLKTQRIAYYIKNQIGHVLPGVLQVYCRLLLQRPVALCGFQCPSHILKRNINPVAFAFFNTIRSLRRHNNNYMFVFIIPSLRGPASLQLLPGSPSSSSCSSRRVRQLSLSALVYSFLPGPPGPPASSKPGRPTSRRSGFSNRRSPLRKGGKWREIISVES